MFRRFAALAAVVVACGLACGLGDPCGSKMDSVRSQLGAPEEVSTYTETGYHSVDWWYWTKGIEYTFTWGTDIAGCDWSKYTFDPIPIDATANQRIRVTSTKKLVEHVIHLDPKL